jgi:hypothetical protein
MIKNLILLIFVLLLILFIGCETPLPNQLIDSPSPPSFEAPQKTELSRLETVACNTADQAGTCTTRLKEVGIILAETCCEVLGKCC